MTARSALLLGASGLVGRSCLELLLHESRYSDVHVVARAELAQQHAKLRQHVIDFAALADTVARIRPADVYCCLGTTIKKAGSQAAFRQVDHDYPLAAAEGAVRGGAQQFLIVTSLGADVGSRIFYNRVKGEVERDISALPLPTVHILRPSMLLGPRDERRAGETVGKAVMAALGPLMIGGARKYRAIEGETVARAMLALAKQDQPGRHIHESDALQKLGGVA